MSRFETVAPGGWSENEYVEGPAWFQATIWCLTLVVPCCGLVLYYSNKASCNRVMSAHLWAWILSCAMTCAFGLAMMKCYKRWNDK